MTPWSIPPLIMASITFYVAVYHLLIYWKRKTNPLDLSFGTMCLFVGVYDMLCVFLYNVSTCEQSVVFNRYQMASIAVAGGSFLWFVALYTGQIAKRGLLAVISVLAVLALTQLLDRSDLTYVLTKPSIKQLCVMGLDITSTRWQPVL